MAGGKSSRHVDDRTKKDLSDVDVIAEFAGRVRDERHLVGLYLLTVADIRGTSPKVWNAWKGKLLEDLFWQTRRHLYGEVDRPAGIAEQRKNKALELLRRDRIPDGVYEHLWSALDSTYLLLHEPEEIAWHARNLRDRIKTPAPVVKARLAPAKAGIQVLVYTADQKDLFARICDFLIAAITTSCKPKFVPRGMVMLWIPSWCWILSRWRMAILMYQPL